MTPAQEVMARGKLKPAPADLILTPKYYFLQQGKKMPFLKLRKCQLSYHRGQFK